MQEVGAYRLPVAEDGDTADMPQYSGLLVNRVIEALNTRAPVSYTHLTLPTILLV